VCEDALVFVLQHTGFESQVEFQLDLLHETKLYNETSVAPVNDEEPVGMKMSKNGNEE
jgi:hypothetical protein